MDGQKDILGCWISENEGASFYAGICSDLKKRGVSDIFIACRDNLRVGDTLKVTLNGRQLGDEPVMTLSDEEMAVLLGGVRAELKLKRNEVFERNIS